MFVVDFLIANVDRHWGNFGLLRQASTGRWLGVCPLFDHGNSLWYDWDTSNFQGYPLPLISATTGIDLARQLEEYVPLDVLEQMNISRLDNFHEEMANCYRSGDGNINSVQIECRVEAFRQQYFYLVQNHPAKEDLARYR